MGCKPNPATQQRQRARRLGNFLPALRSFARSEPRVHGAARSKSQQGLDDPALKAGTPITVVTDAGGHKVKEVNVAPSSSGKAKKDK